MKRLRVGRVPWLELMVTGRSLVLLASPVRVGERFVLRPVGDGSAAAAEVIGVEDWGADVVCPAWRYAVDYRLVEQA